MIAPWMFAPCCVSPTEEMTLNSEPETGWRILPVSGRNRPRRSGDFWTSSLTGPNTKLAWSLDAAAATTSAPGSPSAPHKYRPRPPEIVDFPFLRGTSTNAVRVTRTQVPLSVGRTQPKIGAMM
jgi:hypothetical protein